MCYQVYTCKSSFLRKVDEAGDIDAANDVDSTGNYLARQPSKTKGLNESGRHCGTVTRSMVEHTDISCCLFCQQVQIKVKGKRQKLSECMSFESCKEAIYSAAQVRGDERVLLEVQGGPDLKAKEVKYHRACYSTYTHSTTLTSMSRQQVQNESEGHAAAYDPAFGGLAAEIEQSMSSV